MEVEARQAARGRDPRQMAGRALVCFFLLMAVLTLCSRTLQEMSVATVESTRPQRGALERRIQGEGTLAASEEIPLVIPHAARVREVYVRAGGQVEQGDPLLLLDYEALIREKYEAMAKAGQELTAKRQAYDWAAADVSGSALDRMENREEALLRAEQALSDAQLAYDGAEQEQSDAQEQLEAARLAYDAEESKANREDLDAAEAAERAAARRLKDAATALTQAEKDEENARVKLDGYSRVRDYLTKQGEWESALLAERTATAAYRELVSQLDGAREGGELPAYEEGASYLRTVTAPRAGTVGTLTAKSGALIAPESPALTIHPSGGSLSAEILVDGDQVGDMRIGDMAELVIDGRVYPLPITAIAPASKEGEEGKYRVRFDLPEDTGIAGQRATMYFQKRSQSYDLLVPLSALRSDTQGDYVYVIEQRDSSLGARYTLTRVAVTVLEKDATRAAVTGGLSQGDTLATRGDRTLSEGDRVRLAGE